jgi:DNA-binding XRE family transcriptional regulator
MNEEQLKRFAQNMKTVRTAQGMTSRDLASFCNFKTKTIIARIEECRTTPKLNEVIKICEILGEPIDKMLHQKARLKVEFSFI